MNSYREHYELWAHDPFFGPEVHAELQAIAKDEKEIEERFHQFLSFGTGGLRGIIGAGTNRINTFTVALATEGFARYIEGLGEEAKKAGVCISYDSRLYSPEFAEVTARVFAGHGIKARLYPSLRPTPMLSYAVRYYKAAGGVMITASHNPAKYNGYKAYGEDGGQLPPEAADRVLAEMKSFSDIRKLNIPTKEEALSSGMMEYIPQEVDEAYYKMLLGLSINRELVKKHSKMKIVYTPLHGAGNLPVRRILQELGFEDIRVVKEQEEPDPAFTTCPYPNPEAREALELAIDLASKNQADLVIATDPDSDRMGCCVRLKEGGYQVLTGNQIGCLLLEYILSARQKRGELPEKSFAATTIVSTRLVHRIAEAFGVKMYEVLTGFKFIGELIKNYDEDGDQHFQFGFEESYGYLAGADVRDKDAVVASMLLAEMAATCAEEGRSLYDRLQQLYQKYGYGTEKTLSIALEGMEGMKKIRRVMVSLGSAQSNELAGERVQAIRDYRTGQRYVFDVKGERKEEMLSLPPSDVLLYEYEDLDWACVRPSGTEPKLKIYCGCYGQNKEEVEARLEKRSRNLEAAIRAILGE